MDWRKRTIAAVEALEWLIESTCNLAILATGLGMLTLLSIVALLRYAFQSGLNWAPDLTEVMFAIFVMAGIVKAARRGAHVATEIMLHLLTGLWRTALSITINAITAAVYFLLAWYAFQNAIIAHDQTTPVLGIPWSVGYSCLSTGLGLVATCSVLVIIRCAAGERPDTDLAKVQAA